VSAFENCHKITSAWEKGYVNHPRDPGGATLNGVTQNVYSAYRKRTGLTVRHVKEMTKQEELHIYETQYWSVIKGDQLPPGIDLCVYDMAVNSGPNRAIRYLQAALGVKQDGQIGNVTLLAVREAYETDRDADVIVAIMSARNRFLRSLNTFDVFGKGWMNRTRDIEAKAKRMETVEDSAKVFAITAKKTQPRQAQIEKPIAYDPEKADQPKEPAVTAQKAGWLAQIATFLALAGTSINTAIGGVKTILDGVLPEGGWITLTIFIVVAIAATLVALHQRKAADLNEVQK
jgi:lysozyme family protein